MHDLIFHRIVPLVELVLGHEEVKQERRRGNDECRQKELVARLEVGFTVSMRFYLLTERMHLHLRTKSRGSVILATTILPYTSSMTSCSINPPRLALSRCGSVAVHMDEAMALPIAPEMVDHKTWIAMATARSWCGTEA